ncbi:MAG: hypothetical protein EA405_09175 [Rhodospirillales bacterium]|nr:MAG: hypothetical protein EA405_09175 [Rhodospirillales bacterium]
MPPSLQFLANLIRNKVVWLFLSVLFLIVVVATNVRAAGFLTSWFDESYMADIAYNISQGNGFFVSVMHGLDTERFLYGPVFFLFQQPIINLFGFGEFSARLTGIIFGASTAILLAVLIYNQTKSAVIASLTLIVVIGDISFNRSMISGRMDMLAVFFVVLSFVLVRRAMSSASWAAMLGLCAAAAFLTTPRSAFLLLGVPAMMSLISLRSFGRPDWVRRNVLAYGASGSVVLLLLGGWVLWTGGFSAYIEMNTGLSRYWGSRLYGFWYDNYITIAAFVAAIVYIKTVWRRELAFGFLVSILAYSLLVKGSPGAYAGLVMPFLYAFLALVLHAALPKMPIPIRGGAVAVVFLVVSLQSFVVLSKNANLYVNAECRDHGDFDRSVVAHLPSQAVILSEFLYYFALRRGDELHFQVITRNDPNFLENVLQPPYILIDSKRLIERREVYADTAPVEEWVVNMIEAGVYQPLIAYTCPQRSLGWLGDRIARFTYAHQNRTYRDAVLYQRAADTSPRLAEE